MNDLNSLSLKVITCSMLEVDCNRLKLKYVAQPEMFWHLFCVLSFEAVGQYLVIHFVKFSHKCNINVKFSLREFNLRKSNIILAFILHDI